MPLALLISAFCIFVNLQEFLIQKAGASALSYIDEIACLAAYAIVPIYVRKKRDAWIYIILLIPAISFVHSLIINTFVFSSDRTLQAALQSLINFKLLLYFSIFYCASRSISRKNIYTKTLIICIAISLIGYAANLITPDLFIFSEEVWHIERNRVSGFQFKPNDLAILLGFAILFILLTDLEVKGKTFLSLSLIALIFISSSRTALVFSVAAIFIYLALDKKKIALAAAAYVSTIIFLIFFDNIESSFFVSETIANLDQFSAINQSQYIRAIMIYYGFSLAFMYPLGVGAGNYGSVMSENSPVYEVLGLSHTYFFKNMAGIYDSNFAAILGEYGVIGLAAIILITKKMLERTLPGQNKKIAVLAAALFILTLTQPVYAYQVNSINFLLLLFALRESTQASVRTSTVHIQSPSR